MKTSTIQICMVCSMPGSSHNTKNVLSRLLRMKKLSIQDLVHRSMTHRIIFDSLPFPVAGPLMVVCKELVKMGCLLFLVHNE